MSTEPRTSRLRRFLLGEPLVLRSPLPFADARDALRRATLASLLRAPHGERLVGNADPERVRLGCLRVPADLVRMRHAQRFEGVLVAADGATLLRGHLRTARGPIAAWLLGNGLALVGVAAALLLLTLGERDAQGLFGAGFALVVAALFVRVLADLPARMLALRHHLLRELRAVLEVEPRDA